MQVIDEKLLVEMASMYRQHCHIFRDWHAGQGCPPLIGLAREEFDRFQRHALIASIIAVNESLGALRVEVAKLSLNESSHFGGLAQIAEGLEDVCEHLAVLAAGDDAGGVN